MNGGVNVSLLAEIERGERFRFGGNWRRFLSALDDDRIAEAEKSLREMLGVETLAGKSFLDVGSGSGLFSLAARRLGAVVRSFDFDPESVACTGELRRRYFADDPHWRIDEGSVLDSQYLGSLGTFDVVYAWGVLHHTGAMWQAIGGILPRVAPGGRLFIAIYNDQGRASRRWWYVKRLYCSGDVARALVLGVFLSYFWGRALLSDLWHFRDPRARYRDYRRSRGMSRIWDWVDWLGGFPFETARPEAVTTFCGERGFDLDRVVLSGGWGCNQFVMTRRADTAAFPR